MANPLVTIQSGQNISQFSMNPKEFKTGSVGFYYQGKVEIEGKRYQAQVQLVEIGSKPATTAEDEEDEAPVRTTSRKRR